MLSAHACMILMHGRIKAELTDYTELLPVFATMDNRRPYRWLDNGCGGRTVFFLSKIYPNVFRGHESGSLSERQQSGWFASESVIFNLLECEFLLFFRVTDFGIGQKEA